MYNLDTYCGAYNKNPNIKFLGNNIFDNIDMIKNSLYIESFKYPSKCYITHTTKNYIETTFGLIYSILNNSKYSIIVFTVNFDINEIEDNPFIENNRVKFHKYTNPNITSEGKLFESGFGQYVDRNDDSIFQILTLKPKILLEAFELGIDEGVYLDSDLICRKNIDDLMDYTSKVYKFPLLPRGVYDILFDENGNGDIERPLMTHLGVKERSMQYVQSNIIVFSRNCIDFIKDWHYTCLSPDIINNWKKWTPYHEETIINVLFWKYKNTELLPMCFMNIRNKRFVEEFQKFDDTDKSKYHEGMQGFPFYIDGEQMTFTYIPWNKQDIKAFHGVKDLKQIKEIIEMEKNYE